MGKKKSWINPRIMGSQLGSAGAKKTLQLSELKVLLNEHRGEPASDAPVQGNPTIPIHRDDGPGNAKTATSNAKQQQTPREEPTGFSALQVVDSQDGNGISSILEEQLKKIESRREEFKAAQCGLPSTVSNSNKSYKTVVTLTMYPCWNKETNNTTFKILNSCYNKGVTFLKSEEDYNNSSSSEVLTRRLEDYLENTQSRGDKVFRDLWDERSYGAIIQSIYMVGMTNPFSQELRFRLKNVFKTTERQNSGGSRDSISTSARGHVAPRVAPRNNDRNVNCSDVYLPPHSNKCQYIDLSKDGGITNVTPASSGSSFHIFDSSVTAPDLSVWGGLNYEEHFSKRFFLNLPLAPREKYEYEIFHKDGPLYCTFLKYSVEKNGAFAGNVSASSGVPQPHHIEKYAEVQRRVLRILGSDVYVALKSVGDAAHLKLKEFLSSVNASRGDPNATISYVCDPTTDNAFKESIKEMSTKIIYCNHPNMGKKEKMEKEDESITEERKVNSGENTTDKVNARDGRCKDMVRFVPGPHCVATITFMISFVLSPKRICVNPESDTVTEDEINKLLL